MADIGDPPLPLDEILESAPAVVPNPASGHRARLRKRLLDGGIDALGDLEVIEFLLMGAIPRRDVKPIARALLTRLDRKSTRLNSSHSDLSRMPSSA